LAYVFGRRKDEVFLELKKLLEPLGLRVTARMVGERMNGIYQQNYTK
jgi:IS1 family transposase